MESDYKALILTALFLTIILTRTNHEAVVAFVGASFQENPEDDRSWYYLGREYVFGHMTKAFKRFKIP